MSQVAFYDRLVMNHNYDKSALKLDFDKSSAGNSRKRRFLGVPSPAILQSPDLKLLKLGSPELEKLIINNDGFIPTPTPGGPSSSFMQTGENRAEDQESFARGFIEALQKLQEQDTPANINDLKKQVASSSSQPQRWPSEQRNSVSVITPTRFENRSPPMMRQPQTTSTPVLINFPTVSTGAVSTMGMTAVPRASSSYVTQPSNGMERLSHQTSSGLSSSSGGMNLPGPISSSSVMADIKVKTEDDAIVPDVGMNLSDMNPIDLNAQEHIKHERKKLRNRLAAQRCRKRKIEREDTLKAKVKELKSKNAELTSLASTLRMQVCDLKQQVMHHVNEGCQVFVKDSDVEKNLLNSKS